MICIVLFLLQLNKEEKISPPQEMWMQTCPLVGQLIGLSTVIITMLITILTQPTGHIH